MTAPKPSGCASSGSSTASQRQRSRGRSACARTRWPLASGSAPTGARITNRRRRLRLGRAEATERQGRAGHEQSRRVRPNGAGLLQRLPHLHDDERARPTVGWRARCGRNRAAVPRSTLLTLTSTGVGLSPEGGCLPRKGAVVPGRTLSPREKSGPKSGRDPAKLVFGRFGFAGATLTSTRRGRAAEHR
jgi:hypothetical protein